MQEKSHSSARAACLRWALFVTGLVLTGLAQAQFSMVPAPQISAPPRESAAEIEKEYRIDAAKHLYAAYDSRIFRGKLPPLLYSVMIVETEIDATGQVVNVSVVRKPAAAEVAPWVVALIRRASPFPAPAKFAGGVRNTEIWLVDKSGRFQVDTLTEGQR
jgi:protein TonB